MIARHPLFLSAAALAVLLLHGCAAMPKSPALEDARAAYTQAESNTDVQQYASVNLYDAKLALQQAESAKNMPEQVHLAYLAKRQAELAQIMAERKRIEASLDTMSAQRDHLRIELRGKEAELARLRVKQLEGELADAKRTDRGLVLTLGDVLFATGKSTLAPGAYRTIDKLVTFLNANPERKVAVEGHTDSRGSEEYNHYLSLRRANAVVTAIVSRGVAAGRIRARGFGESTPITSNETAEGRQLNRRVEIIVLNPGKP